MHDKNSKKRSKKVAKSSTLVISSYAPVPDIRLVLTPDLKCPSGKGSLLYIRFGSSPSHHRLGGTALAHCFGQLGDSAPDLDYPSLFVRAFNTTQSLLKQKKLSAGHDVSDGGLIVCILEMAFAGNCGVDFSFPATTGTTTLFHAEKRVLELEFLHAMFSEELGIVLEVSSEHKEHVIGEYLESGLNCVDLGYSFGRFDPNSKITVRYGSSIMIEEPVWLLRERWEETSYALEKLQCNPECVEQERETLRSFTHPPYHLPISLNSPSNGVSNGHHYPKDPIRVAILREQGSNGDREMAAAFHQAGFEPWDVCMQDLLSGKISLREFRGLAFVGGFSYADVLGSAKGWAGGIQFNSGVKNEFDLFFQRKDTFSFGVCNGCQLMALLGWIGTDEPGSTGVFLEQNRSGRFESRFCTVAIEESPAIMLRGMAGASLGVWVSHGEGKFTYKTDELFKRLNTEGLLPLRYVDENGKYTERYPLNPNGSEGGVAGICSKDGRHLAVMPHPERCFLDWQCPFKMELSEGGKSPWFRAFENAFEWCKRVHE